MLMREWEFIEYLAGHPEFEWKEETLNGNPGIFVKNNKFDTVTHFTKDSIQKCSLDTLLTQTCHGRNVEQMTRVTGYFSKVAGWNKGKTGELKERQRVNDLNGQ
jgi:hypothetical protein